MNWLIPLLAGTVFGMVSRVTGIPLLPFILFVPLVMFQRGSDKRTKVIKSLLLILGMILGDYLGYTLRSGIQ